MKDLPVGTACPPWATFFTDEDNNSEFYQWLVNGVEQGNIPLDTAVGNLVMVGWIMYAAAGDNLPTPVYTSTYTAE